MVAYTFSMGGSQDVCGTPWLHATMTSRQTIIFATLLFVFIGFTSWIVLRRRHAKWQLERLGLPTVMWSPRFVHYRPFEEDQKLSPSTITRILPRMERLGGPYGMYGTIYGVNTQVIHVAHPVPAQAIFGTSHIGVVGPSDTPTSKQTRRSSLVCSTGASKAPAYNHFKNFCGDGVFTADGDDWKAKRAAVMHCLIRGTSSPSSTIAQRLEDEANRAADTFLAQVQLLNQDTSSGSIVTNIVPFLQRSTVGLIYRYITHHDPAWGTNPYAADDDTLETNSLSSSDSCTVSSHDDEKEKKVEGNGLLEQYLKSIIRIRMIILAQSRSIWFILPRWCYSAFSSLYQDEEDTLIPIRKFAQQACLNAKLGSPLAQLQTMESHNKSATISGFSKDLLDEAITLLFAGQDTSAATLSWTLHLLSIHPDIQSRLANEVKSVVLDGRKEMSRRVKLTRSTISKLPFLDAVIKESMRLYPVAPFVVRRIQNELAISNPESCGNTSNSNILLPAGSVACIWIYSLHRNPKLWHRPEDFLPDRWLQGHPKDLGQTNGAYMPFAAGPRNCVGQPIAHVVLRTLLARLVLSLEFRDVRLDTAKSPDDLRIEMQAGFTVLPSGGVTVSVKPRDWNK